MGSLKNKFVKTVKSLLLLIIVVFMVGCSAAGPIFRITDICSIYPSPVSIINDSINFKAELKLPTGMIDKNAKYYLSLLAIKDTSEYHFQSIPVEVNFSESPDGYSYSYKLFKSFVPSRYSDYELVYSIILVRGTKRIESPLQRVSYLQ